ncbi:unnamed protein product [Alopecurus aequalis]
MSCSSSRATSRMEIPECTDMPIFVCPRCWMDVARTISQTPRNTNRPFYVCTSVIGLKCFFLWEDVLVQTMMNQLLVEHQEWLPQMAAAATQAPEEEMEGGACIDTEVDDELRRLNQKIRKLEYQAQIPICIWAFVGGMLVAVGLILKLSRMA